jgi:hypothetical protein
MATVSKKTTKKKTANKSTKKISQDAIVSRARRMLRSKQKQLWEVLGFEGEYSDEAFDEKMAEAAKTREASMSSGERQEAYIKKLEDQKAELMAKAKMLNEELTKARQQLDQEVDNRENLEIEYQIRAEAAKAGITDTDYAIHMFKRHVVNLGDDQEANPSGFFESLKKDPAKRYLFTEEKISAGPKPVAQTGAPQQLQTNGQAQPTPSTGPQVEKDENVLDMDKRSFNQRTRDQYGFSPGMA